MEDFLKGFKKSMNKYAEAASIKTCEIAEVSRIKLEIYNLKKEKKEALMNMGKVVYGMYLKNKINEEKIAERCRNITRFDQEIKLKEEEMEKVGKYVKKSYKNQRRDRRE